MDAVKYKVLIADDEYWTREKLRSMISWEKYGLAFLEPAVDGEDVLEKIRQEKPDILITDINMPFVNGVELLKILKEKYPEIITFVISGYDDFNYVKDTFMAGAINYLVKPVTKIDLVNALSKALEIISSRQSRQEEDEKQKLEILKASSLMQDREFSLLLEREQTPFTPIITMNSNMDLAGSSLMLIKIHSLKALAAKYRYDMNWLSYEVKKEIRRLLGQEGIIVFNHIYRSNEFIIISEMENAGLKAAADKVSVYLSNLAASPVTICISEHTYTMDSIHMAYVQVIASFVTRSYTKLNEILLPDRRERVQGIQGRVGEEQEKQLKSLLRSGNRSAVRKMIFGSIGLSRCQEEQWEYLEVKQTVKKILNLLSDYASSYACPKELVDLESMADQVDKTIEMLDGGALCDALEDIIAFAMPEKAALASDSMKGIVKQAVTYINQHYFEEISLTGLAEHFHAEASYLSRVFRQETGETIMVYITRTRMEKARECMQNPQVNLTEIAFMVGYDDYTYFSRVFRKVMGKSPRDYRNSLLN